MNENNYFSWILLKVVGIILQCVGWSIFVIDCVIKDIIETYLVCLSICFITFGAILYVFVEAYYHEKQHNDHLKLHRKLKEKNTK